VRLIARYAKDKIDNFEVVTVYDSKIEREIIDKNTPSIKSISHKYPSAIWFERKMQDDFGIVAEDAFDKRPLIHQEYFPKDIHPILKSFDKKELDFSEFTPYEYEVVKGEGVFQVGVGPIHAGIIEPGHFHFSQAGERMLHLEVRHFYKYRAIEKMLEGKTLKEAKPIIERISANESIAYQIALRDITLQAYNRELPMPLKKEHALALELERVIHHLTDLGFIPNDAGFSSALAFCSKLAEDARRVFKELFGHRFGFGAITFKTRKIDIDSLNRWLNDLERDIKFFEDWILDIPSLWDRLDTTGELPLKKAIKYSVVGVVARASGVKLDRRDEPFYLNNGYKMALYKSGDVSARFEVRVAEVKNSIELMRNFINKQEAKVELKAISDGEYMSFIESSIGELFMAIDIKDGVIDRFFARDASFMNWQALHIMMQKDIIADFPLINKSCDLSYSGSDL